MGLGKVKCISREQDRKSDLINQGKNKSKQNQPENVWPGCLDLTKVIER